MPYICLRLPTGGGKTVLASYAVSVAQKAYLEQDYPVVLWLVPTNTIREQTLEALKKVGHPYRQALENEFGLDRLRVFDVGEVTQIRRQDIGRKTLIIVGTLAALRVEDTSGRKVYVHHEDFEPHFVGITDPEQRLERISEKDLQENGLRPEDVGKIKASFANLLALHQPLVIMDEAHNARTKLTFDTLKRLHPACIIELTATPDTSATSASNILYRCSASELKAENMIKLPIVLTEHKDWQAAVQDAVLTGKKLVLEAAANITRGHQNQDQNDLFDGQDNVVVRTEPTLRFELETKPVLTPELSTHVTITPTAHNTFRIEIKGEVSSETKTQLLKSVTGSQKLELERACEHHNLRVIVARAPSQCGQTFTPLPQLCLKQGELWELLDSDAFLYSLGEWSLLDYPAELPNFNLVQTAHTFEVDMDGKKLSYRLADQNQAYNLDWVPSNVSENDLLFWLEPQVRQIGLIPSQLRGFLARLIPYLTKSRGLPLTGLVRSKYVLARAVSEQIENYRQQAADKGFQYALFDESDSLDTRFDHVFEFSPGYYPARPPFYQGRYAFTKHFYPEIEDLKEDGEEFECAKLLDSHPKVKFWIRNLVNRDGAAFRLPLAKGWFYPDFVAELEDGRILVVEYKGKVYATNDDSREKRAVGEFRAKKSSCHCLFLMAEKKNAQGKGVFQQLDDVMG